MALKPAFCIRPIHLVLAVLPWLVSCGDDTPLDPPAPNIPITPDTPVHHEPVLDIEVGDTLFVSMTGGKQSQLIRCDTTFVVSIEANDWIAEETTGTLAQNTYYKFSVAENTGDSIRCALVTVNGDNGLSKRFVVCQDFPTRVVSQDFYYANNLLLDEKNKVVLHLNREVGLADSGAGTNWYYDYQPEISLNDDRRSVTVSGIDGIGANHTFWFSFSTIEKLTQRVNHVVWGCDYHWKIAGKIEAQCLPAEYPDRHYVGTSWPNRFYCQNPKNGEQLFAVDLGFTPTAMSYCSVNDKVYMAGDDQCVHIMDASTGEECKSVKLDLRYASSKLRQLVMSDEGWGVVLGDDERSKYMIDANRDDMVYQIVGFIDWSDYMDITLSKGPDGKVWFYDSWRQMYRIESAEGPIEHPMKIDGKFNRPDVYYMGGNWGKARWKRGEQKLFVACFPCSQAIVDFSDRTYPFHSLIESRLGLAVEFDLTQTIGDDIIWWARETYSTTGEGADFMILKDETCLFWNNRMKVPVNSLEMLHDNRTMLASFMGVESVTTTHFMIYDVESFYSRVNLTEVGAM